MMQAAVDVGSNTVRLLVGKLVDGKVIPQTCLREVTRLSGHFSETSGLAPESINRTIIALKKFAECMAFHNVQDYRAVATEAVRRANNKKHFLDTVSQETGLQLTIISGDEEADLTSAGVLSVISPLPRKIILIDIGGGSTELVCLIDGQKIFQQSYPLGVVRLSEEFDSAIARKNHIKTILDTFYQQLEKLHFSSENCQVIGTAGTVTTLAAMNLQLHQYDADLINNHSIQTGWLIDVKSQLELLTVAQREQLTGMEPGRGDLIIPGIQILLDLLQHLQCPALKISDSGLLEGIIITSV